MSDHVTEWLNAYLDGELQGSRLQQVEMHLEECDTCQNELASLERLSALLQDVPAAEFTPPERFAAQVRLRLPRQKTVVVRNRILETGWWMIPIALLVIWVLINTSFFIYDLLSLAEQFGLLTSDSYWMRFGVWNASNWSSILGQMGILSGSPLNLAISAETFTRTSLPQITLQVSIALLYVGWFAIWWTRYQRHARQPHGKPLES